jgi:hypothetical protein
MADWPDLAMLKRALGAPSSDKDELLQLALASAIEGVIGDCGGSKVTVTFGSPSGSPPDDGVPIVELADPSEEEPVEITVTSRLTSAALLRAVIVYKAPDAPFGVASTFDTGGIYVSRYMPRYQELLKGHRVRFGIA